MWPLQGLGTICSFGTALRTGGERSVLCPPHTVNEPWVSADFPGTSNLWGQSLAIDETLLHKGEVNMHEFSQNIELKQFWKNLS